MALPVRVEHRPVTDPFELARRNFTNMFSRFMGGGLFGESPEAGPLAALGNYGVDVREDADHIYVEADLPGFSKDDVNISLENGTLMISAERREEQTVPSQPGGQKQQGQKQQKSEYLLHERQMQQFIRSFTLPSDVDEQNVQAKLDNGVLKITLNKREHAKAKRIPLS